MQLPQTTIDRIEKEAHEWAVKMSSAPDKETPDWIMTDYAAGAKQWASRAMPLKLFAKRIKNLYGEDKNKFPEGFEYLIEMADKALEAYD